MGYREKFFRHGPTAPVLKQIDVDLFGLIHFSVNTFTNREWGYGYPADGPKFNPSDFSARQIVCAARDGGLKGLILVCKHHDGFCLWPTKTTEYNITLSPWKNGKGDVVREISDACREYGLKFGVYVSPWDRNNAAYGTPEYLKIFHEQIREVLTQYGEIFEMWFDGANGGDGWYGGAQEKRDIGKAEIYYDWETTFGIVRELQPNARIFCNGPDVRWCGNERGHIDPECRSSFISANHEKSDSQPMTPEEEYAMLQKGNPDGKYFVPAECDFPMRLGWFYHPESDGYSLSSLSLLNAYLNTVGNGGIMNLGIVPDRRGRITDEDCEKLKGFRERMNMLRQNKSFDFRITGKGPHSFDVSKCAPFNTVELVEDIAAQDGEKTGKYSLSLDGNVFVQGDVIGLRRIRILKTPTQGKTLVIKTEHDSFVRVTGWLSHENTFAQEENVYETFQDPDCEDVTDKIIAFDASSLVVDLGESREIKGFVMTPDPEDRKGLPLRYSISVSDDAKDWRCLLLDYGFENIQANPMPQRVNMIPEKCRYFRFESFRSVEPGTPMKILAFALLINRK